MCVLCQNAKKSELIHLNSCNALLRNDHGGSVPYRLDLIDTCE